MMNRPMLLLSLALACAARPAQAQDDLRPDSVLLAGVLANGTGGCRQRFLLRRGDSWRAARQAWMEQLPDSVGGGFWKGTYINPMTLQGQAALYRQTDANCCPSRILYFRVRLEGDALVLRDHRAVATEQ
jgi:hypothetical protein